MIALGRMPRSYFDVTTDGQFVPDELGLDLPSLAGARKEARVTAAEMAKEGNGGPHEITIEIRDANELVATVRLSLTG
jgi:hypothetical protein